MTRKSSAYYQREYRRRLREQGLVKKEVWILPEHAARLAEVERQLRMAAATLSGVEVARITTAKGEQAMVDSNKTWTTVGLFEALRSNESSASDNAAIELVDGADPAIHIVMRDYGDLPLFMTVCGDQIIVEAVLWSTKEVNDVDRFNDMVLRTHKYFPLSTISLEKSGVAGDYYYMFGALSAKSSLEDVVLEVEMLASNVIQATEAYAEHLTIAIEA